MEQDDAFHLTAVDVRRYEFATVMRGYDRARVDQFKQQVADEIERLMRSNLELEDKARNFHEQLRAFRERDRALNEALISAQELRNEVKSQAKREAELFLAEAEQQGARLRAAAQEEIASLLQEIEQLDRTRRAYLAQLKMFAERHLAEVAASEAERPFIEHYEYAETWGHAMMTIRGDSIDAEVYRGMERKPWKNLDLSKLLG